MRILICCIIIISKFNLSFGQNVTNILHCSDSLIESGNYESSYEYLTRYYAIAQQADFLTEIELRRAKCLLLLGKNYESIKLVSNLKTNTDLQNLERTIILSNNYIKLNNPLYALHFFSENYKDSALQKRMYFNKAICYLMCDSFDAAHTLALKTIVPKHYRILDSQFKLLKLNYKSPKKAKRLNLFPGLGYYYANDFKNAINSFLLNAVTITLSVVEARKAPLLGLFIFSQVGVRYYWGGSINAGKSAVYNNNKFRNQYMQTWKKLLVVNN